MAALVEVSPGVYQMGALRLDKQARALRFPGTVNMEEGLIEYALVSESGAKHESLLVTLVQATEVHAAMLLLGAKGAPPSGAATGRFAGPIFGEALAGAVVPQGDSIEVELEWREAGVERRVRLEEWIFRQDTQKAMERGAWVYSGSFWAEGTFVAQAEGNLAAVVWNPGALVNHQQAGGNRDEVWCANKGVVPMRGTAVEIVVTLRRTPL
ncbi:MAG: hypothetical protein RLZZ399_1566 [Verrucomicrobiota bacterium]